MMIVIIAGSGLGLLTLPAIMRRLGRRLCPRSWSWLTLAALISGSFLLVGAGLVSSMSTMFLAIGLATLAHVCDHMLGQATMAGSPTEIAVAVLTATAIASGARGLRTFRATTMRSWAEPGIGARISWQTPVEVVLLADVRPRALSVPARSGRSSQVWLTTGLVEALTPQELDLVFAHEAAHLRHGHSRYLAAAIAVERGMWFWPPVRSSAQTLRIALERWADEVAVGEGQISRTRLRSALLSVATGGENSSLAAFSGLDGLLERLAAMSEPSGASTSVARLPMLLLPGVTLGALVSLAAAQLGDAFYCALAMAGGCSIR